MLVSEFDYDLPPELIAQHPLARRDDSRMMIVERKTGKIDHGLFREFADHMDLGGLLVLNDTKVIPARVWGERGGAKVEFLFIESRSRGAGRSCAARRGDPAGRPHSLRAGIRGLRRGQVGDEGQASSPFRQRRRSRRTREDRLRAPAPVYQEGPGGPNLAFRRPRQVPDGFRQKEGAVAAPTAGLHFTKESLLKLKTKGVDIRHVTLDVGLATFQPVRAEIVLEHGCSRNGIPLRRPRPMISTRP